METYNIAILYAGWSAIKNFIFKDKNTAEKCARSLIKRGFKIKIDFLLKNFPKESSFYFKTLKV